MGRRLLAALFTLAGPGLGQLYNGQPRKAIAFLLASWAVTASLLFGIASTTLTGLILALATMFVIFGVALLDAVRLAPASAPRPYSRWWVVLGLALLLTALSAFVMPSQLPVRSFYIPSGSMEPALQVGDRLIAKTSAMEATELVRGQIVIFRSPENPETTLVDRVLGLPGEVIEMRGKVLLVDGVEIPQWAHHRDPNVGSRPGWRTYQRDNFEPLEVPSGHVFVMGDNRDFSYDSRYYGPVPIADIIARPVYLYWSADKSRIGLRF